MEENIIEKHRLMTVRLAKPGASILQTLTASDCHLIHMGGCLMGEASELFEALIEETEVGQLKEELGDAQFYVAVCLDIFGLSRTKEAASH
jgi:phosphoribosyl-ATP pyrophosphohydrolase